MNKNNKASTMAGTTEQEHFAFLVSETKKNQEAHIVMERHQAEMDLKQRTEFNRRQLKRHQQGVARHRAQLTRAFSSVGIWMGILALTAALSSQPTIPPTWLVFVGTTAVVLSSFNLGRCWEKINSKGGDNV